jgi:hypothetical protein
MNIGVTANKWQAAPPDEPGDPWMNNHHPVVLFRIFIWIRYSERAQAIKEKARHPWTG